MSASLACGFWPSCECHPGCGSSAPPQPRQETQSFPLNLQNPHSRKAIWAGWILLEGGVEEVYIAVMQTVSKWTLDISVLKASAALEMLLELLPRLCPRHRVRFTRPAFSPASLASSSPLPSEINPKKCTLFSPICLVLPPPFPQLKSTSAFAQASQVRYPEGRNKREKLVSR